MEKTGHLIGSYAPDFELPGTDNQVHHLRRYLEQFQAVGVVFLSNHCPHVQSYLERLQQIQTDFRSQGATLIGINANDAVRYPEEDFDQMQQFAAEHHLNFPYLRDVTQDVARSFAAEQTPEVFVLDQTGIVQYQGAIDDDAQNPAAVQSTYLRQALTQVLQGHAVEPAVTDAVGCSIKWRS